jgi:hypothetical protein
MLSPSVYIYTAASGLNAYISTAGNFNYRGIWSSSGTYASSTYDVVSYANGQYVCTVDNVGINPQSQLPKDWSVLGLVAGTGLPVVSSDQIVYYVNDPNVEGVQPPDVSAPAITLTQNGSGAMYAWNIDNQVWN